MVTSANKSDASPGTQVDLQFLVRIPMRDGVHLAANLFLPK
jgi:predicted acyl esterase